MKSASTLVTLAVALAATSTGRAQTSSQVPYPARAFTPAHGDLARAAGVPAQLANEEYIEALARLVYYWGYPAVDVMTRTSQWETMRQGPGAVLGVFPGGPVNTGGCLSDYMSPSHWFTAYVCSRYIAVLSICGAMSAVGRSRRLVDSNFATSI
jgi:hypothetical protein